MNLLRNKIAFFVMLTTALACQSIFACTVDIDIKPQSCPNPINVKNCGVITIAIIGWEGLKDEYPKLETFTGDNMVELLYRVNPEEDFKLGEPVSFLRWHFEDVSSKLDDASVCCERGAPDGILDLVLQFSVQDVVDSLNLRQFPQDTALEVQIRVYWEPPGLGNWYLDGTDCVIIKGSSKCSLFDWFGCNIFCGCKDWDYRCCDYKDWDFRDWDYKDWDHRDCDYKAWDSRDCDDKGRDDKGRDDKECDRRGR